MSVLRLHGPSMVGRARADLAALLLVAGVVAATGALTSAVPPLAGRAADRAVADAVARSGTDADVVVTFPRDVFGERGGQDGSSAVAALAQEVAVAEGDLPAPLARVSGPPVASVTSVELKVLGGGPGRYLRLAHASTDGRVPAVTWVEGGPPGSSAPAASSAPTSLDAPPRPVQVGLSRAAAAALGAGAGERLSAEDPRGRPVEVRVSGVFTADDPSADAWRVVPTALRPVQGSAGQVARTSATALVTDASLGDLRSALAVDALVDRVTLVPRAGAVRARAAPALARSVAGLQAASAGTGETRTWDSLLPAVLDRAGGQVAAARAQAAVVLTGLLLAAALVLVLAATLLAHRRSAALAAARQRGAALAGVAAELAVESVAVALAGAAAGLALARAVLGEASWAWPLPVAVVAAAASPLLGTVVAARATSGRRAPANRSARRAAGRARRLRRVVAEVAVVALAAAAVTALVQRGVGADGGTDGPDLLSTAAPALSVVAGVVLAHRALPVLARAVLGRARRSPRGVPFLAAAGAAARGGRVLPFLVVALAVALPVLALSLAATTVRGQSDGAWQAVGADARLDAAPSPALAGLARQVAAAPGVRAAVPARVAGGVAATSGQASATVRLVVVDPAGWARLLDPTPLPGAPALRDLAEAGGGGAEGVPALVSGGGPGLRDGLRVTWQDGPVALDVVGTAPAVGSGGGPVVVVGAAAFARAGGEAEPGTVWAVGPGAAQALRAASGSPAAGTSGSVVARADVLADRRDAPLPRGLVALALASATVLAVLGAVAVVLSAAAASPARLASLARLRTLGLRAGEVRAVVAGELVPPVAVAALAGLALGALCASTQLGLLDLARATGQDGAVRVLVPWWAAASALPPLVAAAAVARVESSRGRAGLGRLLRAGGPAT